MKEIVLNYRDEREDLIAELLGYTRTVKEVQGTKLISKLNPLSKQEYIFNKMQEALDKLVLDYVTKAEVNNLVNEIKNRDEFKKEN